MARNIAWLVMVAFLLGSSLVAFGQITATASIAGTVSDPQKAVVSGAQVTVTNKGTGSTRTVTTGPTGAYRFDLLEVGTYTLKVAKTGFSTTEVPNLDLRVGRTATLDLSLSLGTESQTVEVSGEAPIVDEQKSDVALSITPRDVQNLPLNGRDFGSLAILAPGARPVDSYDPTKNRVAVFSVGGGAGRDVNVTVNGVDNKDNTVGGPVMQFPLEAIQEFNISTQRFSAANGRSEGAAINVITKAGTNDLHGSLYFYDTEKAFNATDHFTEQSGGAKKDFSRQQFGGSVGLPIRKDSDFVFFSLERLREKTAIAVSPDAYADLLLAQSLGAKPATSIPTPYYDWRYLGRYDHHFSGKHNLFFTYSSQSNTGSNDQANQGSDLTAGNTTTNQLILSNLTLESVLSNSVVNSALVGFQYWNNNILATTAAPLFTFTSGANFGTNGNVPQQSYQRKWQFKDDLAISKGNHGLKFGVDYLWEPQLGGYFKFNSTLEVDFADSAVNLLNPAQWPNGFASPGAVEGMSFSNGDPYEDLPGGAKMLGLYFQDDWKVSRRLTLNLGVRYDKDYNLVGGAAQDKSRTFLALKAIGSPFAAKLPHDDNLDFSPRVGFAWDVTGNGRHVLRGGYGLYYGQTFLNIPLFMIQQANPTLFATVLSISGTDVVPGTGIALDHYRFGVDPLPTLPAPATALQPNAVGRIIDPNYRNPYRQQWNIGYAFELNPNNVIELEYVHTLGLHESKTVNINPKDPLTGIRPLNAALAAQAGWAGANRIDAEMSIDRSRYDGLNLSYRRRMSRHISINSSYVLSRAVCYRCYLGAAAFRNRPTDPNHPLSKFDFGFAPSDERHRLTFGGVFDLPWGFQLAPIMQWASARPFDALYPSDLYGYGQSGLARPALVPTADPYNYAFYSNLWQAGLDAGTLTLTDIQHQTQALIAAGTARPAHFDSLRGKSFFNLDLRVSKNFKFGDKYNLRLISQFFDLTNRANYGSGNFEQANGSWNGDVTSSSFRQPQAYFTPNSVVVPQAFRAEFGAEFRF